MEKKDISLYTKNDYDIKKLNVNDKVQYNMSLLNYNLEANQQLNNGLTLFQDLKKIKKDPISSVNTILIFVALCLLLITLIIYFIYSNSFFTINPNLMLKLKIVPYMYAFVFYSIILLIFFYYIFNYIQGSFYISK
jgi:hypothetical protein